MFIPNVEGKCLNSQCFKNYPVVPNSWAGVAVSHAYTKKERCYMRISIYFEKLGAHKTIL